jgi:LmbE family N-acetylglucosaminyl deacetylase
MPTIIPLTPEEQWLPTLRYLPPWGLPAVPTLVLAPHPDDETLGAGGLIAKLRTQGTPVTVVAVTDGESAYDDMKRLNEIRVPEQTEALRRLGVRESMIQRLKLPDRDVSSHEDELVDLLLPLVTPETLVIAPWPGDFHPDHEAVGRAAARVSRLRNSPVAYYLFWTWHRGGSRSSQPSPGDETSTE